MNYLTIYKKAIYKGLLGIHAVFWCAIIATLLFPFNAYSEISKEKWLYVGPSDISAGDFYVMKGSIKEKDGGMRTAVVLNVFHVQQMGIDRFDASGKNFYDTSKPYRSTLHLEVYDCKNKRIGSFETRYFTSEFPSKKSLLEVDIDPDPKWFSLIIEKRLFNYICSK